MFAFRAKVVNTRILVPMENPVPTLNVLFPTIAVQTLQGVTAPYFLMLMSGLGQFPIQKCWSVLRQSP